MQRISESNVPKEAAACLQKSRTHHKGKKHTPVVDGYVLCDELIRTCSAFYCADDHDVIAVIDDLIGFGHRDLSATVSAIA